jgi:hypothetical protein
MRLICAPELLQLPLVITVAPDHLSGICHREFQLWMLVHKPPGAHLVKDFRGEEVETLNWMHDMFSIKF